MDEGGFDAAFLAVGAHISKAYIPAENPPHPRRALRCCGAWRRAAADAGPPRSSTAAATPPWTARIKRLGASDAIVVYRRNRERMPAHDFEVEEAEEEE